jgi:hypothetical protein
MPLIDFHWESKNTIILLVSGLVRWSGDQVSSTFLAYSKIHEAARVYAGVTRMTWEVDQSDSR